MSDRHVHVDITIPSDLAETHKVQADIENALQSNGYDDGDVFAIRLAVEEALVNAMKHGNQLDPDKMVHVKYSVTDRQFEIQIPDEGSGFNPADVPDPTDEMNIERPCGRGVFIIKNVMTRVDYLGRGNVVFMTKIRGEATEPDSSGLEA
jgi:serine/threonine-protein kinase RsbW